MLMSAANFLDIKSLVCLGAARYSLYIRVDLKGDVEKIRKLMGIENDYTPEEEQALAEENKWIKEDDS